MRVHRPLLLFLFATVGAAALAAQPAAAEPYGAQPPAATVSAATVADGGTVTFSGGGFIPLEQITIDRTYTSGSHGAGQPGAQRGTGGFVTAGLELPPAPAAVIATISANSNGDFSTTVTLTEVGVVVLTAVGQTSGVSATATVTVVAAQSGGDGDGTGGLAVTGNDGRRLAFQVGGAVAAILVGAVLVWLATMKRRRRVDVDA